MVDTFICKLVISYVAVIIFVLFMIFIFEGDKIMKEKKLKENERFCFKCKKVMDKSDFNPYYQICDCCIKKSTGH